MALYHKFDLLVDSRGNGLANYLVSVLSAGQPAPIYSDAEGTPIVTLSGIANAALTDISGNYEFWVEQGTYDLQFSAPNGVPLKTIPRVDMSVVGTQGPRGNPGGVMTAIGTFVEARTAMASGGLVIPPGVQRVRTSGYEKPGVGAGDYAILSDAAPLTRGPNLIVNVDDWSQPDWFKSTPGLTVTFDGTYSTLTDTDSGGQYTYLNYASNLVPDYLTVAARFAKDGIPPDQRKVMLRAIYVDNAGRGYWATAILDTQSGLATPRDQVFDLRVVDDGADWLLYVTNKKPDVDLVGTRFECYPAYGPGDSQSTATTGSVRVRGAQMFSGFSDQYTATTGLYNSFTDAVGRMFSLALDQPINKEMFGCDPSLLRNCDAEFDAFSTFVSQNYVSVDWGGPVKVSQAAFFGPTAGTIKTRYVAGRLRLVVDGNVNYALILRNIYGLTAPGGVEVVNPGGQDYNTRTTVSAVKLDGNCGRAQIGYIGGDNTLFAVLDDRSITGNYNFVDIGLIRGNNCGSGSDFKNSVGSLTTAWTWMLDGGNAGSFGQYTRLKIAQMWPAKLDTLLNIGDDPVQYWIDGASYYVKAFSRDADGAGGVVDIYPWLPTASRGNDANGAAKTGSARLIMGAAYYGRGGNALTKVGQVDTSGSGRGALMASLHGTTISILNFSYCQQGVLVGRNPNGVTLANQVGRFYAEVGGDGTHYTPEEIVMLSPFAHLEVLECHSSTPAYWFDRAGPRLANDAAGTLSGSSNAFRHLTVHKDGKRLEFQQQGLRYPRPTGITVTAKVTRVPIDGDAITINLSAADAPLSAEFGYAGGVLYRVGTGTNGIPTNNTVFNAPTGGTVNGGGSVSLAGGAFLVWPTDAANLTWRVRSL